jgi:GTPase SAR1 family protein
MALYYGQVVIGPAGSGKSTYCHAIQDMASMLKRRIMVINLDPAAESFKYRCDIDIRDLISLDDVMQELSLGPNGGLVYCLEYLLLNMEWL